MIALTLTTIAGATLLVLPAKTQAFWPFDWGTPEESSQQSDLPPFVQRLVDKFGLNKDEVIKEIQVERQEKQAEMQTRHQEKMAQAIKDGLLTQEQADELVKKMEEQRGQGQDLKDLSPEERQAKMEQHRLEMEQWAKEQGIDLVAVHEAIGFGGPGMGGEGKGKGRGMGMHQSAE